MIIKNFETNKINTEKFKYFLFYGNNKGHIEEIIKTNFIKKINLNIYNYDESEIINDKTVFFNEVLNNSFFEKEKIIIISRITDKSKNILEEIREKKVNDIIFIFVANILEKKSKLRKFFEENDDTVCIAFYPDNTLTLSRLAGNFFKDKKISISQSNINFIINKCNEDRGYLLNELKKIELFSLSNKKITNEDIVKLINLTENHNVFNLVESCLSKDKKKVIGIINDNNFTLEDSIIILRTFLTKTKKLLILAKQYQKNNDINETIATAKPPIFWKEKETVKKQILNWTPHKIKNLILKINETELEIKKNRYNPINITLNFIFEQTSNN